MIIDVVPKEQFSHVYLNHAFQVASTYQTNYGNRELSNDEIEKTRQLAVQYFYFLWSAFIESCPIDEIKVIAHSFQMMNRAARNPHIAEISREEIQIIISKIQLRIETDPQLISDPVFARCLSGSRG